MPAVKNGTLGTVLEVAAGGERLLDYGEEQDLVRRYAERRGLAQDSQIVVPPERGERAPKRQVEKPASRRSKFAGLKLDASRGSAATRPERPMPPAEPAPARVLTGRERQQARLHGMMADYGPAWSDAERMREVALPVLPYQEKALEREYEAAGKAYEWDAQRAVGTRMEAFAKELKGDPRFGSLLRAEGAGTGHRRGVKARPGGAGARDQSGADPRSLGAIAQELRAVGKRLDGIEGQSA